MSQIVGIDLGTTNSLIGVMDSGFPILLAGDDGSRLTPSVVYLPESGPPIVGAPANRMRILHPERTITSVKRLIGRRPGESDKDDQPYTVNTVEGQLVISVGKKSYSPEEISSLILTKLKLDAERTLGEPVTQAVITVPAYFNDGQRQATKRAGELAGFAIERIINEPTAAALAYGLDRLKDRSRVAVYDLGGGTFDISILELNEGVFRVLSTNGNTRLGGDDIDRELIRFLKERIVGRNPELLPDLEKPVGRSIMEVFRNHMLQRLAQRTADRQDAQFGELQVTLKDNSEFVTKHFQVTSVELRPPGKESTRGILMVFHDITQIRSLEAVRRDLVANVSHELRTPLAIISGYLETLLDPEHEADETTRARFLNIVQRHASRLNLLVEDLLELSRLESGRLPLRIEPVDVRSCVEQVLERLDERVRDSRTEIEITIPPDLPPLEADALRFEQIIFNVLDNALKYGNKEQPRVAISAEPRPQELALTISDNGPGIPAADQPHIFERFYRVHKDRSRHGGGTGLGLSIVKHSIQAHGGSVNLTSEPGAGTTFVLRFPWKRAAAKGDLG